MRFITRSSIPACFISLVALAAARPAAAQQTSWSVSTAGDLTTALAGAFNNNVSNPSLLNTITLTGSISSSSQWIVNANVNIVGNGYTIDMQNADRAFFIAGGTVGISNITIQNGQATGGNSFSGGAGAGLGGAIFVGSGTYLGGALPGETPAPIVAFGLSAPTVTLNAVSFTNNRAVGGSAVLETVQSGGGGGMGGSVGPSGSQQNGLGGGGFGNQAVGGNNSLPGGPGAFVNIVPVSGMSTSGGPGGNGSAADGTAGGVNGGGGGIGGYGGDAVGSGGGGGLGGARGYYMNGTPPDDAGNGGFGGGGGGGSTGADVAFSAAGMGGFGGGGGAQGSNSIAGNGGFGGGGGGGTINMDPVRPGHGGFGAGGGTSNDGGHGGGGLGAGGAIFVMNGASVTLSGGAFSANSVTPGTGGHNGSAYGADLFLGGNVVFSTTGTTVVNSLGGAGNLADPNVSGNANDPNANGGVIMAGSGMLLLTGSSYYSGITTVNSGVLALDPYATEQGTTVVTVGQNPGDVATLGLASSSSLTLAGFNGPNGTDVPLVIAQAAGSTGAVVIGNGAGSNGAYVGARVFTGGAGNASVLFTQQYSAPGTSPVYPFLTTLTGTLGIVQDGIGTTSLQPLYGPNTFAGPVTVNTGTLATTGTAAALAGTTSIAVNAGGALALGQTGGVNDSAAVTLAGGVLQTGVGLSETFGALSVTGAGSIIDFLGTSSTLNFSSLSLGRSLAIWNYAGANDFLNIASGTATGSLAQINFFSDSGSTFLGYGGFEGTRLVPVAVPEPSTWTMALAGLACGGWMMRRRRVQNHRSGPLPRVHSSSHLPSSGWSGHPTGLSFMITIFPEGARS